MSTQLRGAPGDTRLTRTRTATAAPITSTSVTRPPRSSAGRARSSGVPAPGRRCAPRPPRPSGCASTVTAAGVLVALRRCWGSSSGCVRLDRADRRRRRRAGSCSSRCRSSPGHGLRRGPLARAERVVAGEGGARDLECEPSRIELPGRIDVPDRGRDSRDLRPPAAAGASSTQPSTIPTPAAGS